jgi:hypothetical protein
MHYVSSRGIVYSCQYHNRFPHSSTNTVGFEINDTTVFPFLTTNVITIYVCSSAINDFVENYLPRLKSRFVLVSGDSDATIPTDCIQSSTILLNHPNLIGWYSQNCVGTHPKLHQIPIGLDYHTMASRDTSWGKQTSPQDQEDMLIRLNQLPFWQRNVKCYGNFHFAMNHRYAQIDRVDAKQSIPSSSIDYEESPIQREETWKKMSTYAFIPSPHGNGLDCHRTWEALALGCIVIVRTSPLDTMYTDLPVWIVQEWDEVTEENMRKTIQRMQLINFDMQKLTLRYWLEKIKNGY